MFTEKHILGNPYNNHKLSRTVTGYEVSAVDCNVNKTSGYSGTTVNLTPTTASKFSGWAITGAELTGSAFKFNNGDVTAQGYYYLPIMKVGENTAEIGPRNADSYLEATGGQVAVSSLPHRIVCIKFEGYNYLYSYNTATQGSFAVYDGSDTTNQVFPGLGIYSPWKAPVVSINPNRGQTLKSRYNCSYATDNSNAYETTNNGFQNTWTNYRIILDLDNNSGRNDVSAANAWATYTWSAAERKYIWGIKSHCNSTSTAYQLGLRNLEIYSCETWADALSL